MVSNVSRRCPPQGNADQRLTPSLLLKYPLTEGRNTLAKQNNFECYNFQLYTDRTSYACFAIETTVPEV